MGKLNLFIAALLVLLAASFRLSNLDLIEFKADEAINLFLASRPLFGHSFPPGGTVSSLGVSNFPLVNYLLFPAVLISTDPRSIVFLIGTVNSLSIGVLFLIFNSYHGIKVAVIASLLLALSPWAILFSRKIWAQDLVLPLTLPFIFSLYKIVMEKKDKFWILYLASCLLLVQIHQSTVFFLAPLSLLLVKKRKPNLKYLFWGLLIGIIPTLPYIMYQAANNCPDCIMLISARERLSALFFPEIFIRPFQILGRGNFQTILGDDMVTFLKEFPLIFQMQKIFYLEYLLLPLGFIMLWKKIKEFRIVLVSIVILPFIYFVLRIEPFIHYFLIILPFLFLMLAVSISWLLENGRILVRSLGAVSLMLVILASVLFNYALFELIKQGDGLKGDYGKSYVKSRKIAENLFIKYQNDFNLEEMIITSYIPPSLLHGDIGIAKLIYSEEEVEKRMPAIDERLANVPEDSRMHAKLIYYYTKKTPTRETLELLKQKSNKIPGYLPVYLEVKKIYLENN